MRTRWVIALCVVSFLLGFVAGYTWFGHLLFGSITVTQQPAAASSTATPDGAVQVMALFAITTHDSGSALWGQP